MDIRQTEPGYGQPNLSKTSMLGLIFFMLGVPNLYALLSRPTHSSGQPRAARYAVLVLLAGVFAGIFELSVL